MKFVTPDLSEVKHRLKEPLYKNSFLLLLNHGVGAILGFAFWIVAARYYPPSQVGVVSALIAAIMLLVAFSRLGFDMGLIRFLPGEKDKSGIINSCLTITCLASLILSLVFAAGLDFWSPALSFIRGNIPFLVSFIIFTVAFALSIVVNAAFIACRHAEFSLFQTSITGVLRIALPILAVSTGTFGLFFSWGIGVCLAVAISLFLFLSRVQPKYRPLFGIQKRVVNDIVHFSSMTYIAMVLGEIPKFILPLLIISIFGSETTAYFRIAWTTSSVVFLIIPIAISTSLFAEGSYNPKKLRENAIRAGSLMLALVIAGVAIIFLSGDKILLLFGTVYSAKGLDMLRILALSGIPMVFIQLYFTVRLVQVRVKPVVFLSGLRAVLVVGIIFALTAQYGFIGVGIGWTVSQTIAAVVIMLTLVGERHNLRRRLMSGQNE